MKAFLDINLIQPIFQNRKFVADLLFSISFIASSFLSVSFFKRFSNKERIDRFIVAIIPPLLVTLLALFLHRIFYSTYYYQNWARLQKTFAFAYGFDLYSGPDFGPALTSMYGPVSVLGYLPATLANSPIIAMRIAELLNIFYFFLPVYFLHMVEVRKDKECLPSAILAFLCFCCFAFLFSSVKKAAFNIHADAMTFGLCAMACLALRFPSNQNNRRGLFFSALFTILAIWSKQLAVPLIPALCVYLLFIDGIKTGLWYTLFLVILGSILSILFILKFGFRPLFFNLFTIPEHQPWKSGGLFILGKALLYLFYECFSILIVIFLILTPLGKKQKRSWALLKEWVKANQSGLFVLIALMMIPSALLGYVKIGGSNNNFSYASFFLMLAATLSFVKDKKRFGAFRSKHFLILLAFIGLCIQVPMVFYRIKKDSEEHDYIELAYNFAKKNPGKVYYPTLPLINLMAERKLYHDVTGLIDREWAGIPLSEAHLRRYIPPEVEIIAFPDRSNNLIGALHLPEFPVAERIPELPRFFVYKRHNILPDQKSGSKT